MDLPPEDDHYEESLKLQVMTFNSIRFQNFLSKSSYMINL
jgi:hypothetical protein